jgi:hypothetical protein
VRGDSRNPASGPAPGIPGLGPLRCRQGGGTIGPISTAGRTQMAAERNKFFRMKYRIPLFFCSICSLFFC